MDFIAPFSKHIIARIYSWHEDTRLFEYLKEYEKTQRLSPDELEYRQILKLRRLLIHAYETVDFYRSRFTQSDLNPYMFRHKDELSHLPFLTKNDIINNTHQLISNKYGLDELVKSKTGGSTGTQLHFMLDKKSEDMKNACAWRHNRWANWDLGLPVAAVWGNPPKVNSIKNLMRYKILMRFNYIDTMMMSDKTMSNFAQRINKLENYIVYGHAHSIYLLANYLGNNLITVSKPRGIVTTSMMLMDNERKTIEETFGCKVTNRYGCEEVGLISSECEEHNGMHINTDNLFVELIKADGTNATHGEQGKIILTDLTNYGMPFIRYEVGDMGVSSCRLCPCVRGLPLMEKVVGRTADFLIRKDGSMVAGVSLIERFLTKIPGIKQMQIIQNEKGVLDFRIVLNNGTMEEVSKSLDKEFRSIFPGSGYRMNFVNKIPQEKSGKYRFSICNIK